MKKHSFRSAPSQNLFDIPEDELMKNAPLSARMRPRDLSEYVGQRHILEEGKLLPRAIASDRLSSLVLYGPPGSGKTTLAHCVRGQTRAVFERVNAVASNVEELRKVIASSQNRRRSSGQRTILFVDEIHRFNKAQQEVLMPDLENGNIILIGATVFNPYFSLVSPLLSRSLIFELRPLTEQDILTILKRAIKDEERGLGKMRVKADEDALVFLSEICDGDARRALNALEVGCLTTPKNERGEIVFNLPVAQESIQQKQVRYDRQDDEHYDTISAFIKSMRGSDPDATLYWLAKMLYAGEDPRFIARRICICAAEDVGNADPRALLLAHAAFQVCEFIGLPEGRIPLAQAAVYVACAPKSNAAYLGIEKALDDVKNKKTQAVPEYLKDASYRGAKKMGRGQGYKYAHDFEGHFVIQDYMGQQVVYYEPTDLGFEKEIKERLKKFSELKGRHPKGPSGGT